MKARRGRCLPRLVVTLALVGSCFELPIAAQSFYLSPDVPTDLGGLDYLPWETVRNDGGTYAWVLALPQFTAIDGLHRMDGGDWLLSVESPTDLGGTTYQPEDVIRFNGSSYSPFLDGSSAGVPPGSDVDALFLIGGDSGDLIISFEAPTTIGPQTYEPADLVRFAGGVFTLFLDASATTPPIPPDSNVTAADQQTHRLSPTGNRTVVSFDVPTTLGGTTYLPGELVAWNGVAFSSFYSDAAWPTDSRQDALAFLANPGRVLASLRIEKRNQPRKLRIRWGPSCSQGGEDYGIYEGVLGSWYSHTALDCNGGSDLQEDIHSSPGNRYYLVVPHNPDEEGSYGSDSALEERPFGTSSCVPSQSLAPCP